MGLVDKLTEFLELRNQRKIALKQCRNCEILANLLENERRERNQLINQINQTGSKELGEVLGNQFPVKPQVSWQVKRHQLEQASQEKVNARNRQE